MGIVLCCNDCLRGSPYEGCLQTMKGYLVPQPCEKCGREMRPAEINQFRRDKFDKIPER